MSFVWSENAFDEIVIDEWVDETGFQGSVRVTHDAVMLSVVDGLLREHTRTRGRDLFETLSACLAGLHVTRHAAAA